LKTIRILLVDDHQIFREALRSLLEKEPNFMIVGETGNAFDVIKLARETLPGIVCMDIGLPGMNGIQTTQLLVASNPAVKVIALSSHLDQQHVANMMNAGASAYVTKSEAADELLRAIHAVLKHRKYFSPEIADLVSSLMTSKSQPLTPSQLSNREIQVLQLVAEGHTSSAIADKLHIAQATVLVHRRNFMKKLNLHNAAEITRYALTNKILSR